jgi:hypothetical protein
MPNGMWRRDQVVEDLLKRKGISFEYKTDILTSLIQLEESPVSNPRHLVTNYEGDIKLFASKMENGEKFPAIVITKDRAILCGNHRVRAAKDAGWKTIDAYVIGPTNPQKLDEFVREDNNRHGRNLTDEEKIEACVELFRKHKTPMRESCMNYFGNDATMYTKIQQLNMAREVGERLALKGIDPEKIPNHLKSMIHPFRDEAIILRDLASLSIEFGLNQPKLEAVLTELDSLPSDKRTETEKKSIIEKCRKAMQAAAKTGHSALHPETSLLRALTHMESVLNAGFNGKSYPPIDKLIEDRKERKKIKEMITKVIDKLKKLKERV